MKCQKCGRENPADSEFCQYCGSQIQGSEVKPSKVLDPENYFTSESPQKRKSTTPMSLIAALIVAAVLAVLNVVQYTNAQGKIADVGNLTTSLEQKTAEVAELTAAVEGKDKTIEEKEAEIASLSSKISGLEKETTENKEKVDFYDDLWSTYNSGENYGYATNNFKVSDGVVVLMKGGKKKTITLTANFSGYVQVESETKGVSADVKWNQESWSGSTTTLDIISSKNRSGTTTITFTNDQNNKSFKVLVIVL